MDDEDTEDYYRLYKILLLGDSAVGKSCLLLRYCDNAFQETHLTTIGLDFRLKTVELEDGKKIKIQIWDTAGQDRFRAITRNYYKGANGILLVFDVTDEQSFEHIKSWIEKINEEAQEGIITYLVGNKIDNIEKRVISEEKAKRLGDEFKLTYFETSAKSSLGVNEVFSSLIKEIHKTYQEKVGEQRSNMISFSKKKKKKCC